MAQKLISTLPLQQDAQFMVIDEDEEALNAENLLNGWMQIWSSTNTSQEINYLSFFHPKSYYDDLLTMFPANNLKIHDYCSVDINKISDKKEINLESIMKSIATNNKSIVIINCLSSLIVDVGLGKAIKFVEKLSQHVYKLICIYRYDFGREKVPSIETLGTTYVQLGKCKDTVLIGEVSYEVSVVHRKQGGGILKKEITINQDLITNEIKSEKIIEKSATTMATSSEPTIKPQASFRTDMNSRELEQRNQTPLPYLIKPDDPVKESQIYYVPDFNDDIDEEDPDDDLPF
ncbi:uncharacterized protein [Chelonus insularis]|uniref:uncharacterized protein n=1 Tax=Chelonus insularis TaxID=460826 RepID=UPI0015883E73|nr:uncharacterized protein LOC118073199 [Chelonus insularis]